MSSASSTNEKDLANGINFDMLRDPKQKTDATASGQRQLPPRADTPGDEKVSVSHPLRRTIIALAIPEKVARGTPRPHQVVECTQHGSNTFAANLLVRTEQIPKAIGGYIIEVREKTQDRSGGKHGYLIFTGHACDMLSWIEESEKMTDGLWQTNVLFGGHELGAKQWGVFTWADAKFGAVGADEGGQPMRGCVRATLVGLTIPTMNDGSSCIVS